MGKKNSLTPMMEQYFRIKKEHKDSLLFFRLGDFYEMFYQDAKIASAVLEIALTSRQKVPMCGVPYHSAESYISKLLKRGFKISICEQVEDPKESRGVVKREVVKTLTPGTAVEMESEGIKENTFILSVVLEEDGWGLALVDLAEGNIKTAQNDSSSRRQLSDELFKFSPRELIFPQEEEEKIRALLAENGLSGVLASPLEAWVYDITQAGNYLKDHFQVDSLEGFDLADKPLAVSAAGGLIYYLKTLRRDALNLIQSLSFMHSKEYMIMDASTVKNLELVKNLRDSHRSGSLLEAVDFTVSSMGGRLLRSWLLHPVLDISEITSRQDAVEECLAQTISRQEIRDLLAGVFDLERLTGKISLDAANPKDVVSLKKTLHLLPQMRTLLDSFNSSRLSSIKKDWDNGEDVAERIDRAILDEPSFHITEGGIIKAGFSRELDELREISRSGKSFITGMEKKEKQRTGISSLKIRYNKVFGYYIEVTKPNLSQVPGDYIRKQTLLNSERFITPELKEYEEKVLHAEERINHLEHKLFLEVREELGRQSGRLHQIASALAQLDVFTSLGELASQRRYCRPGLTEGDALTIKAGRHPVIEIAQEDPFIPNDTYLDRNGHQILIITGPNMGGKSTYLRQVALCCILAQMGSFIPADEAEIGMIDRIFTRIGAMDFLSVGQSTFMVEMLETANILNNATPGSLILLDEVGRGTSTFDGLSLAWAIAEHLHQHAGVRPKTLFATHYHELTELDMTMERIKNFHVSVKEDKDNIVFLRKIISGPSDQSYGIHVAKLAGIPKPVIERAKEILFNLEKKELDATGIPRISYRRSQPLFPGQMLLFEEDREVQKLKELRDQITGIDINDMTPVQALNLLQRLQEKIAIIESDKKN
jgi:DNA mismatch repair protein MutS